MNKESILIAGEFQRDRLGASYERAFQKLGHAVHRFEVPTEMAQLAWPARNRVLHRLTIGSYAARRAWSKRYNQRLRQAAEISDAPWVFLHNGIWVMPETVRALREQGRRVAIFHADNPYPPHYNHRPEGLLAAREADLYLIWSEQLVAKLRRDGVNAHFLAFGWDPDVMPYHGELPQGSWPGVVFIGGWDREREAFLDQIASVVPLRIYGPGYWGSRTRRDGRARACWQGRELDLAESARVIRESAVCLNILRTQHVIDGEPDGVIMRHFEVPGAGGFLLSSRSSTADVMFLADQHADYFANADECIGQCVRYIDDPDRRAAIVERGHDLVREQHTYLHRAGEVVARMRSVGSVR
ncbi:MAG TPA: glycosyltransferase [Rhodanobacteraceae bacterium]|nr:glycosyltransferase [Rhodanobacteraceae bacterium]